jgi:OOP family OmpA-OmpF porin
LKLYKLFFVLLLTATVFGQAHYTNGSGIGFGWTTPRLFGDAQAEPFNFTGAHAYFVRDWDELNTLRGRVDYVQIQTTAAPGSVKSTISSVALSIDYLFKFVPCAQMQMYFGTGMSIVNFKVKDPVPFGGVKNNEWYLGELAADFIVGAQWDLTKEWALHGEFNHHTLTTDRYDGQFAAQGGLFGGTLDSYVGIDLGVIYYFTRGEESKYCDAPSGMTSNYYTTGGNIDYDKIQNIVNAAKQPAPAAVDYKKIEDIVGKKVEGFKPAEVKVAASTAKPVFVGINFNVNDATILRENYIILAQVAMTLMQYPDINLDVVGHTDSDGSDQFNDKLSLNRANNVRDYLIAKGIDGSRLTAVAMSEGTPVASNENAQGKALNRRVEFKVK